MRAADLQLETPPPAWLLHKPAYAIVPVELNKAVGLARAAGVLLAFNWSHSGRLLARAHDEETLGLVDAAKVPAYLAGAIARAPKSGPAWLALLDAMEDLAALVPWWEVAL